MRLAQALLRHPTYVKTLRNPPAHDQMQIDNRWLGAIHLSKRYRRYTNYGCWKMDWWKPRKAEVFDLTLELLLGLRDFGDSAEMDIDTQQHHVVGQEIAEPDTTDEAKALRITIFLYQQKRRKLVSKYQDIIEAQSNLMYKLKTWSTDRDITESERTALNFTKQRLTLMAKMRKEIQQRIGPVTSETSRVGQATIDRLLDGFMTSSEAAALGDLQNVVSMNLDEGPPLPPDAAAAGYAGQKSSWRDYSDDEIISAVRAEYPKFNDQIFYQGVDPAFVTTDLVRKRYEEVPPDDRLPSEVDRDEGQPPIDRSDFANRSFTDLDHEVATALKQMGANIDQSAFNAIMAHILAVVKRPVEVETCTVGDTMGAVFFKAIKRPIMLRDQLFHLRHLVARMYKEELIQDTDGNLNLRVLRCYAVIAILFGLAREASIWLTVMDDMLYQVAECAVGSLDALSNSDRMYRLEQLESDWDLDVSKIPALGEEQRLKLERANAARMLFSEAVRFYRGAAIYAYQIVSRKQWNYERLTIRERVHQQWFNGLLRFTDTCGYPDCIEALKYLDFGEGTGNAEFGLSVGTRDVRHGWTLQRYVPSDCYDFDLVS